MKKLLGAILVLLVGFTLVGCDGGDKKPVVKDPEIEDKEDEIIDDNGEEDEIDEEEDSSGSIDFDYDKESKKHELKELRTQGINDLLDDLND